MRERCGAGYFIFPPTPRNPTPTRPGEGGLKECGTASQGASLRRLLLDSPCGSVGIPPSPTSMTTFRVRYSLYRMEGENAEEAKKSVCEIMKAMPEKFISVEVNTERRPLWKLFLLGR